MKTKPNGKTILLRMTVFIITKQVYC